MSEVVDLRNRQPVSHEDKFSAQLVQDLARFSEGLATEKEIRRRYKFDEATWNALGENEALFAAIEDTKTQRVRTGALKRELSQKLVTQAPDVLGEILLAKDANPRHRIDAARTLDDFSADKTEAAAATDRFIISIVLNSDDGSAPQTLHFNKPIAINVDDTSPDPNRVDDAPQDEWLPMLTSNKTEDGGSGQPL